MSLAMYAAPFDNNEIKEENIVEKKRIKHNKLVKKKERNAEN
jgi:hypothetical protein